MFHHALVRTIPAVNASLTKLLPTHRFATVGACSLLHKRAVKYKRRLLTDAADRDIVVQSMCINQTADLCWQEIHYCRILWRCNLIATAHSARPRFFSTRREFQNFTGHARFSTKGDIALLLGGRQLRLQCMNLRLLRLNRRLRISTVNSFHTAYKLIHLDFCWI